MKLYKSKIKEAKLTKEDEAIIDYWSFYHNFEKQLEAIIKQSQTIINHTKVLGPTGNLAKVGNTYKSKIIPHLNQLKKIHSAIGDWVEKTYDVEENDDD